ncbi:MAG: FliM/FliN family flagellar motor C-terminal domain-containing protein [Paracoccaceae bacterium]
MTDGAPETVLKRKAAAGRGVGRGATMTPARALTQALARTAETLMKLPLRVVDLKEARMSLAELPERLAERSLLAVLEGPGEALGLMALAPGTLATLIEMQTTGRIGGAEPLPRRPTRTDAAMSVRFIDGLMGTFETLLASDPAVVWAGGFRYASCLDDPRPLVLLLEDQAYRSFRLTVDFGAGAERRGDILIALPAEGSGRPPAALPAAKVDPGTMAAEAEWQGQMETAVLGARVEVDAVLDRVTLPLSAIATLAPGSEIALSSGVVARVRVEGRDGQLIGWARLGQCQGSRALRLRLAAMEDRQGVCGGRPEAALSPAERAATAGGSEEALALTAAHADADPIRGDGAG